jgi:hypothetical protein
MVLLDNLGIHTPKGSLLLADADRWAHTIPTAQVLSQIGSPFAPDQQPTVGEELNLQHELPGSIYRASPNEVTSRSMVHPLRHKDFACGMAVTPFGEAL